MNRIFVSTALSVLCLLSTVSAPGQVATSEFFGTVRDNSGAVVPGVQIRIVSDAQGVIYTAITNEDGYYAVPNLLPGGHSIEAAAQGFSLQRRSGVTAIAARRIQVDIELSVGSLTEAVEVRADATLLETGNNEIGQTIETRRVLQMPLNGRNYLQLATLGVNAVPFATGERQGTGFVLGGSRYNSNNLMLDGVDNNTVFFNRDAARPPLDSVSEFRVITNSPSAEYGRNMGGVVTVVTKSGGNEFHGSAYHFHRNNHLNARNAFSSQSSPFYLQNQFGASIGGPVVRNRLFFFTNVEFYRASSSAASNLSVPPAAARMGIFPSARAIFDPNTTRPDPGAAGRFIRDPYAGNRIPESQMDPVGRAIVQNAWPLGNISDTQYRTQVPRNRDEDTYNNRFDYRLDDRTQISGRHTYYRIFNAAKDGFPVAYSGAANPRNFGHHAVLSLTRTFSPTLLNEARLGFNRFEVDQKPDNFGTDPAGAIGLAGTSPSKEFSSFPSIQTSYAAFGTGSGFVQSAETTYHILDNLTWVRTSHTIKIGFDIRRLQSNVFGSFVPFGQLRFGPIFSSHPSQANTGDVIADMLLGYPQSIQLNNQFGPVYGRQLITGAYFQDDYRVSSKLTLNLGLRHEVFTVPVDKYDRQANPNLDNPLGEFRLATRNGQVPEHVQRELALLPVPPAERARLFVPGPSRGLSSSQRFDFSPRFGFAYHVDRRSIVRGGFGLYRGVTGGGTFVRLGFNPPNFIESFLIAPDAVTPVARLQNGIPSFTAGSGRIDGLSPRHLFENNRTQTTVQWNVDVQREIARDVLVDVGYIGSRGRNLTLFTLENQIRNPADYGKGQAARPVPLFGNIWGWGSGSFSWYQAGTLRLEKRFSQGVSALLSYTYSKAIDNAPGDFAVGNGGISVAPIDSYDLSREYGLSVFDTRHRLVISNVYELPLGKGRRWINRSTALDLLLGGWQLSGIASWQTGIPIDVKMETTRTFSFNNQNRPDRIRDGSLPSAERSPERWFDVGAFVAPPDNTLGNSGRNVITAPGVFNIDATLGKSFRFGENRALQFRTEFFNLTNEVNLAAPTYLIGNPNIGRILGSAAARQIQFGLRLEF